MPDLLLSKCLPILVGMTTTHRARKEVDVPKYVLAEELHLAILVPADLPMKAVRTIRRILGGRPFAQRLATEANDACRSVQLPRPIKVRVTK